MSYLRALLLSIRQLVNAWSGVDRIRISPTEGRLLNLTIGQTIHIQGQMFLITGHNIRNRKDQIKIVYRLQDTNGHGTLTVCFCRRTGESKGQLSVENETRFVFDDDVLVRQTP